MTFYYMIFLFLFLSVLLGKIYNRIQSILFFLWIIFFATITAIRDGVGTDFESYVGIFEITPQWDSLFSTMPLVDWGFWYLNSTVKTFGGDVVVLFFFTSFITTLSLYFVSKRILPQYTLVVLLIFYSFLLLRFEFNTIRHGIMAMCTWLGFTYIPSRNFKLFFIYVFLGGLFHVIGFFFIPFYWLLNYNIKPQKCILGIIISYFIGFYIPIFRFLQAVIPVNNIIGNKLFFYTEEYYATENSSAAGITLGLMVYTILFFMLLYYWKKIENYTYALLLRNSLFWAICFALLFNQYGVFVERFTSLLYISIAFIIPMIIHTLPKDKLNKLIFYFLFLLYCFLLLTKNLSSIEPSTRHFQYIPYRIVKII